MERTGEMGREAAHLAVYKDGEAAHLAVHARCTHCVRQCTCPPPVHHNPHARVGLCQHLHVRQVEHRYTHSATRTELLLACIGPE